MKNLGKILILFFLTPVFLNADVKAFVDATEVSLGDVVTLTLTVSAQEMEKPNLVSLCDSDILSTGSQTSIQMINLDYKKSYTLTYKFMPKKSCTIEAIEVVLDSKIEKTQPIQIEVNAVTKRSDANFDLTLESTKKELFVGEPFDVDLILKQKRSAEALDSKFTPPEFKGFWIKGEKEPIRYNQGAYTITKITYRVAPQREGYLEIAPAQMSIASRANIKDNWGAWSANVKWKSYFSNDLNISAKALPNGMNLVGDFTLKATVDKAQINANEAVNVTIEVEGEGNLEDIQSFKPFIAGVSVFDEKISIANTKLTQKIAFVADGNFTIEPFVLRYFDLKTKEIKEVKTQPIEIEVIGVVAEKKELLIKRDEGILSAHEAKKEEINEVSFNFFAGVLLIISGFIFGIVTMLLRPWKYFKKEKTISSKEPKVLLIKLFPYKENEDVQNMIDNLEKNIYEGKNIKIDKKVLQALLKKYAIS